MKRAPLIVAAILLAATTTWGVTTLDKAKPYLTVLQQQFTDYWPACPMKAFIAGQVENESSWNPHATLKTSRELGRGLTQPTIAYTSDGKERFNAFKDAMGYKAMRGWDWKTDPYNVTYQLRLLVLRDRDQFAQIRKHCINDLEAAKGTAVCYNAGEGRWLNRHTRAIMKKLPDDRWTGGLELAYSDKEKVLLYGEPLYQAVNRYPRHIAELAGKYEGKI